MTSTQRPIKLHWASSKPNFGDALSPLICEIVSHRRVVHSDIGKCDLVSTGSLLQRKKEHLWNRHIHVWGSGFIEEVSPHKSKHYYHAVRGKKSASIIHNIKTNIFGDPGLLSDQLIDYPRIQKLYRCGIVPHYKDEGKPSVKTLSNQLGSAKLINVFDAPLDVLRSIAQCEFILSSSLHGIVVADSFGIPCRQIRFSKDSQIRGGSWKFRDYYSAFDLDAPPPEHWSVFKNDEPLETLTSAKDPTTISAVKEKLLSAFPSLL